MQHKTTFIKGSFIKEKEQFQNQEPLSISLINGNMKFRNTLYILWLINGISAELMINGKLWVSVLRSTK